MLSVWRLPVTTLLAFSPLFLTFHLLSLTIFYLLFPAFLHFLSPTFLYCLKALLQCFLLSFQCHCLFTGLLVWIMLKHCDISYVLVHSASHAFNVILIRCICILYIFLSLSHVILLLSVLVYILVINVVIYCQN